MTIVWPQPSDSVKHASTYRFQGRLCRFPRRSLCNRPIGLCRQRTGPCEQGRRTVFPRRRSVSPEITDYVSERAGSVTQAPGLKCYPRNRLHSPHRLRRPCCPLEQAPTALRPTLRQGLSMLSTTCFDPKPAFFRPSTTCFDPKPGSFEVVQSHQTPRLGSNKVQTSHFDPKLGYLWGIAVPLWPKSGSG